MSKVCMNLIVFNAVYSWVGMWMTCRWLLDVLAAFSRVALKLRIWVKDETFYSGKGPTDHSCPLPSF